MSSCGGAGTAVDGAGVPVVGFLDLLAPQPEVFESSAVGVPLLLAEPPWLGQEAAKTSRWWRGPVTSAWLQLERRGQDLDVARTLFN